MSTIVQDSLRQLSDEHSRLDGFLTKLDAQCSGEPPATAAKLKTECVVVLTHNHGHFVMDYQDIITFMRDRRDRLAKELCDYTVLGENIGKLRSPDGLPS